MSGRKLPLGRGNRSTLNVQRPTSNCAPRKVERWKLNVGSCLLFALLAGATNLPATNLPPATVSFLDGSFLRGEIQSLDGETLKWLHPNARAPIEFTTTNLSYIRLPQRVLDLPTNAAPVCRVVLAGGDEFEGRLVALDADSFEVETWFAGRLRGRRAGLQSLAFYGSSQTALYDGPRAANEWKISSGAATVNRAGLDIFGGRNFAFPLGQPAVPVVNVEVPPRIDVVPASKPPLTPQELVAQLKAEIASLGEKVLPAVKQTLEKRLQDAEAIVAKQAARRAFTVEELARLSDDAERSATVAVFLKTDLVKEALKASQTSEATLERWFADFKDPNDWAKDEAKAARFKVMLRAEVDVLVRRLQGRAAAFVEMSPEALPALPLPVPANAAVPERLVREPVRVPANAIPPPPAPAVDPVAQALRLEIQRKVGEGAVRAGELPPLAPAVLPPNAPERAGNLKPTAAEISRLSSTARFSNTIADYLKSDLVKLAVDSGLVKLDAVKDELDKQVAAGAIERTALRRDGALLAARLLRELEHLKNDPLAASLARTQELLAGVRPAPMAPIAPPLALPPPAVGDAAQWQAAADISKKVSAATQLATSAEWLKSDLMQAAMDAGLVSQRAEEEWLARQERNLEGSNEAVRAGQLKLILQAEAMLLGIRLLNAKAPAVAAGTVQGYEQARERTLVQLGQMAEVRAVGNAAADVLAQARARVAGGLAQPEVIFGNAEAAFAGRAALAPASAANAAWQFRDGAYYSTSVGTLGRECFLPAKARIEFDLAWKGQPYFRFSFYTRSTDNYDFNDGWQFYTSSSGYIYSMRRSGMGATSSSGARVPQMLAKNSVRFTFLVNTEKETVVLLADGERVHEWKTLGSPGNGTGIIFYNYNASSRVRVSDIRVAPWDGRERDVDLPGAPGTDPDKLVEVPPADSAVVEFVNSDRATGTLHGIRDGKLAFNPAGTKLEIPVARAALITFPVSDAAPPAPAAKGVQLTLHRNERLTLMLEKWDAAEVLAVSPVFGKLKLKPEAVRTLRFNPSAPRGATDEWSGP